MLVVRAAGQKPPEPSTPFRVYSWFFWGYRVCNILTGLGYACITVEFLGVSDLLVKPGAFANTGIRMMFYGLYYGVLGRDAAELCADRLAVSMGYGKKGSEDNLPQRAIDPTKCLICGQALEDGGDQASTNSMRTVVLGCGHSFHAFCIRGWTLVGKKETCPYCSEKVRACVW